MNNKEQLMIKIAKMYYLHDISQKSIAEELGISRGYVCQLLSQARESGIIQVTIRETSRQESDLEKLVCRTFDLKKAIIVTSARHHEQSGSFSADEISMEACRYLEDVVKSNMIIAFAWGKTIYQLSCQLERQPTIKNIDAVPLCGGTSDLSKRTYVSEISGNIAKAYNGTALLVPLPAILESEAIKNAVYSDYNIKKVLKKSSSADIALFTVGEYGEKNSLYLGGYIDNYSVRRLSEKGAVGDLCAHFINEYGDVCDEELDRRTVSVDLHDFRRIQEKICIVSGMGKVKALLGALRKRYVDVLVSDEETIMGVLKLADIHTNA